MGEKRILCVGLLCLDIVSVVEEFPVEDTDKRCIEQVWQRGGNASNNCSVLSLLGAPCQLMATVANSHEKSFLLSDCQDYGVGTAALVHSENGTTPTSIVIVSSSTGSRTILHHNANLPELTLEDFQKLDLSTYKWIHFEGRRNLSEIIKMLGRVDEYNGGCDSADRITTSVEIEKTFTGIEALFPVADVVFVSKEHASAAGYSDMQTAAKSLITRCRPRSYLILPWGEQGAAAVARADPARCYVSRGFPPPAVVDTLAAGDTFMATCILALSRGWLLPDAITIACQVAGHKCGMRGNKGLRGQFVIEHRS